MEARSAAGEGSRGDVTGVNCCVVFHEVAIGTTPGSGHQCNSYGVCRGRLHTFSP